MKFLLQCDVDGLGLQIYILQKVIYKYNDARMYYILSFIRKYIFYNFRNHSLRDKYRLFNMHMKYVCVYLYNYI